MRVRPSASASALVSAAISRLEYGPGGSDERPTPRLSKVITRSPAATKRIDLHRPALEVVAHAVDEHDGLGALAGDAVVDVEAVRVHDRHPR